MLLAKRVSDGQIVDAYFEREMNGPFRCVDCNEEVVLRSGRKRINHFAHTNPLACEYAVSESEAHLRCKLEIYKALQNQPNVKDVMLERRLGSVRPDISATINGVPVAIEVQISSLSVETIMERTIEYHRKGIYVLWLLLWTPALDQKRYAPKNWEKWLHACYFGRVYYWHSGLEIFEYTFEPSIRVVPQSIWNDSRGNRLKTGGYAQRSVRFRAPIRVDTLDFVRDFGPFNRRWWQGGKFRIPDATVFISRMRLNR